MSTGCEVNTAPVEYKSGEMRTDLADGDRARKVAFITGVTGQDGSYLVELLLAKGTRVDDAMRTREVDARRDVARGCGRSSRCTTRKKVPASGRLARAVTTRSTRRAVETMRRYSLSTVCARRDERVVASRGRRAEILDFPDSLRREGAARRREMSQMRMNERMK